MAHYSVHKPGQLNILAGGKQVVVTPLSQAMSSSSSRQRQDNHTAGTTEATTAAVIDKILVKVFPKGNKKESKTFTLRHIDTRKICSCDQLKLEIRTQLKNDVSGYFDVGYFQGATHSISSKEAMYLCDVMD